MSRSRNRYSSKNNFKNQKFEQSTTSVVSGSGPNFKPETIAEHSGENETTTTSTTTADSVVESGEQTIPEQRYTTNPNRPDTRVAPNRHESMSCSENQSDQMDTASSGDEARSEGSEFGAGDNIRSLEKKMPQICQDIAYILKLNVKNYSFFVLYFLVSKNK